MTTRDDRSLRRAAGALAVGLGGVRLAAVPDPRATRGRKWPAATLLRTMLVGLLSGMKSLKETERLTDCLAGAMRRKLGVARRVPDTTMREFAMALPFGSALALLHGQVRAAWRKKQLEPRGLPCGVMAIDGKCATTDLDDGVYAQQQADGRYSVRTMTCSLVSAPGATVVHITPVPRETNEMGVFQTVVRELDEAYGRGELFRLVTTDAGMTSLANADFVHNELKMGYVFALKGNQPELHGEAVRLLGNLPAALANGHDQERLGDERHHRRVWLAPIEADLNGWAHAKVLIRVQRQVVTVGGGLVRSGDDRYFISNEAPGRFTPDQWLAVIRSHWRVENDVHKTLDVILGEDDHPWIRDPRGMLVLQILRRIACNALNLLRLVSLKAKSARGAEKLVEWSHLLGDLHRALLAALEHHLEGLRWGPELAAPIA